MMKNKQSKVVEMALFSDEKGYGFGITGLGKAKILAISQNVYTRKSDALRAGTKLAKTLKARITKIRDMITVNNQVFYRDRPLKGRK